jgi:hypothetical protein
MVGGKDGGVTDRPRSMGHVIVFSTIRISRRATAGSAARKVCERRVRGRRPSFREHVGLREGGELDSLGGVSGTLEFPLSPRSSRFVLLLVGT